MALVVTGERGSHHLVVIDVIDGSQIDVDIHDGGSIRI